jgi:hypothetical protein
VKPRLSRTERVQFVLRVEFRQHLIGCDAVADIARPFDDAAADAEGE